MNILLVEDNRADADLLTEFLSEKDSSYNIHWVNNGDEALDYVLQRTNYANAVKPDIILLDIGLPKISGYDVLKEIKKHPLFIDIPIVVLTTSRNIQDNATCLSLGADTFISKPYNLDGYDRLIQQLIDVVFPCVTGNVPASAIKN